LSADNSFFFIQTIRFAAVVTLPAGAATHMRPAVLLTFKTNLNYIY